jgi:general secretion pathway protein E
VPYAATDYERKFLNMGAAEDATLYRPAAGQGSGYRGRTGIYELAIVDEAMRQLIHDGAGELELERHARQSTPSIRDDGRHKILSGVTTLEEVLRVTRED